MIEVTTTVWKYSVARHADRLVLLCLADLTNRETGTAWPGAEEIARRTKLSLRAVRHSLRALVRLGELAIIAHGSAASGRANEYRITVQTTTPVQGLHGAESAPLPCKVCTPTVQNLHVDRAESAPHPLGYKNDPGLIRGALPNRASESSSGEQAQEAHPAVASGAGVPAKEKDAMPHPEGCDCPACEDRASRLKDGQLVESIVALRDRVCKATGMDPDDVLGEATGGEHYFCEGLRGAAALRVLAAMQALATKRGVA